MRRPTPVTLILLGQLACQPAAAAPPAPPPPPILPAGTATDPAREAANKLIALDFQITVFGDQDPKKAAATYLATEFRNHDVEEPSGAAAYAAYVLNPAAHAGANASRCLFAISEGDLTMTAQPSGEADPSAAFRSHLIEVQNGRVTELWSSGPTTTDPAHTPDDVSAWFPTPGATIGRQTVIVPNGTADPAQRAANKRLVEQFIQNFFVRGDAKAASILSPTIKSHVPGIPSGAAFATFAAKHPDRLAAPEPEPELFALADGNLVDIGYPAPYAGDPGAWYAQTIVRVQDGKITEWWYSGYPKGHPKSVWKAPKK